MELVFIGGPLHEEAMNDIRQNTKGAIWYSADNFQKKLLKGIDETFKVYHVFSAPLIGAYPIGYKKIRFNAPRINNDKVHCVSFFNVWGIRNFSRAHQLKRAIKKVLLRGANTNSYLIIVYCAHEPFLEAAKYLKDRTQGSKICFYVPDLPQYMNLFKHSFIYDFAKRLDVWKINKLIKNVDSFVILTEQMKNILNIGNRPYAVVEGIIDKIPSKIKIDNNISKKNIIKIVYAGGLQTAFGIGELVEQFVSDNDSRLRLIICGAGDEEYRIRKLADIDKRIEFKGQISPSEVTALLNKADILINPRTNNTEYTKYSFPSKNIEYLMTGKRVVACMLDGMPNIYKDFIYQVENGRYMETIREVIEYKQHEIKVNDFLQYAKINLYIDGILKKIIELNK